MFVTETGVERLTGYDVTMNDIVIAQTVIESYVGRVETAVTDSDDRELLERATAYQCAYMKDDSTKVFEQASVSQISQYGQMVTFRQNEPESPWVAPLARMACKGLSWRRSRSIKSSSIFNTTGPVLGWSQQ